jgi:hypothetical protein
MQHVGKSMDGMGGSAGPTSPGSNSIRRQCAVCRRELQEDFVYCPYCGVRFNPHGDPKTRWRYSRPAVLLALGTVGPFALPLVWFNPRYDTATKIVLTVLMLALTAFIIYALVITGIRLIDQIRNLTPVY